MGGFSAAPRPSSSALALDAERVQLREMECRSGCGACCVAPSISSPIPGMPHGKPAGVRCVQLLPDLRCALFGKLERPAVCVSLRPSASMCGQSAGEAMRILAALELATAPVKQSGGAANMTVAGLPAG